MSTDNAMANWVNLMVNGTIGVCRANSCHAHGYYYLSYDTPIAKFCGDHFEVATKKYSVTTSKHQSKLRMAIIRNCACPIVEVDEVKDNGEFMWRR